MNAKARLQALEAALRKRGVVDVKFFFTKNGGSLSELATDAADVLQAILEGRTRKFTGLNDMKAPA